MKRAATRGGITGSRTRNKAEKKGEGAHPQNRPSRRPASASALPPTRYLFFGGKGGVGKTTAAAAAALHLLDQSRGGRRILLFSTDPAHSLSDSLDIEIGDRLAEAARRGKARLIAREMDASAALARFKEQHGPVLSLIAERGTLLDESDINQLFSLSLPGLDEVMALFELSEFERQGDYARIVVDTAPSGHTSRLLQLPEVFTHWVGALDRMQDKHRYMVARLVGGGGRQKDEVELFLRDLSARIESVRAMLYDRTQSAFTLVTVPEAMVVEETARYYDTLRSDGVPVTDLIINRVEQEHEGCLFCRARAAAQKPWLERIARDFKGLNFHTVPLLAEEVRGPKMLRRFAHLAWEDAGSSRQKAVGRKQKTDYGLPPASCLLPPASCLLPPEHLPPEDKLKPRRLLIFGGKGGVGKTTAAAAAALALAESDPAARVLVFSTDPAHSLSDSFAEPIGEYRRGVAGQENLDAKEIDPQARFEELKERYRAWTDELFASLTAGSRWEIQFDREAMREVVTLAPPGMDEIAALSAISDLVDEGKYTCIVLDTAPTGHLVRFLELPGVALSWVQTFMKLLLKYKGVANWGGIAEELIALSKSIKRLSALLTDANECEFIGVAIPERMSLEETVRLAASLRRLRVPMRRLLINNVVTVEAASGCGFCAARRRAQESVIEEFRRRFRNRAKLLVAPQQPYDINGREQLLGHFACWQPLGGRRGKAR
ncbi:MAG TPA: ArsA family ATPase [Blastocatellia bacterium]|nr:ArsA family ATPase [Blastocatellia bacterium]